MQLALSINSYAVATDEDLRFFTSKHVVGKPDWDVEIQLSSNFGSYIEL